MKRRLAAAFDLIRFLAEPDSFRRTHITVRGPYSRQLSDNEERRIHSHFTPDKRYLEAVGIGSFFFGRQNTVVLHCDIPGIRDIWNKPDFREGKPHLTLYDGKSREFALVIRNILRETVPHFNTKVSELVLLEKKRDPSEYNDAYFSDVNALVGSLFGEEFSIRKIQQEAALDRVVRIGTVARAIKDLAKSPD